MNPGGGGGGALPYAYWVCAAQETPIFGPKFPPGAHIIFTNDKNLCSRATILYFFAAPETGIFEMSFISFSSPPTDGLLQPAQTHLAFGQCSGDSGAFF